jgi:hypothetical protein
VGKVLARKITSGQIMDKKLGYYVCNGQEFRSKVQCGLYASTVKQPMRWVFNEQEFTQYNWSNEPASTLDQLYDRRAREIRDKYDYVVLNYSGGSDSHNILMSFHRQGLLLDEIVSNWIFDASKKFTVNDSRITSAWNQNAEYELNAREKLDWVRNNMPRTKVSVYDCGHQVYTYFANAKDESWVNDVIGPLNPAAVQRYNVLSIKDIRTRIDKQKSIGMMIGIDKPRCSILGDQLYLKFNDTVGNIVPVDQHLAEYDNCTVENFYWSPDACELLAKQAHVVRHFLNANKQLQPVWQESEWFGGANQTREDIMKTLVYTTWDENKFQVSKPVMDWYSEYDYWFTKQLLITPAGKNWEAGVHYLKKNLDPSIFNPDLGFHQLSSPAYYIGDIER